MVASTHLGRSGFYKEDDTSIVKQQRQKKPVAWELLEVPVCDKEIVELKTVLVEEKWKLHKGLPTLQLLKKQQEKKKPTMWGSIWWGR